MNYVGKLLSNFKGFYNEINSATLTGAIDVLVVQQEDGSYVSSPFHVRFGKMGVLRSKEKVVDIEVNGSPVDLHMKLGDAGEAFFVQEAETSLEVPAHLATSPLPNTLDLMESGLEELRAQSQQDDSPKDVFATPTVEFKHSDELAYDEPESTIISCELPGDETMDGKCSIGIQTEMTGLEAQDRAAKLKAQTCPGSLYEYGQQQEEASAFRVVDETDRAVLLPQDTETLLKSSNTQTKSSREGRKKKQRPIKHKVSRARSAADIASMDSGSSNEETTEAGVFPMDLSDDESTSMSRSASMPLAYKHEQTKAWADKQASLAAHPFSDGDITPIVSPIGSRPPSPKSDTEYEVTQEGCAQTHLTGDNFRALDEITWHWGELPQNLGDTNVQNEAKEEEKPSRGLLHFMRQSKKFRHNPEQGGMYLQDLHDKVDPEVAQLYLYPHRGSPKQHIRAIDEDNESGRGASLPQSPVSLDSDREHHELMAASPKVDQSGLDLAMSLCGGLTEAEPISDEKFLQFMVSYDDFVENPSLMQNPNLVVRMDGKYYNWQVAGPMLMSILCFQRSLAGVTVDKLLKEHQAKKEAKQQKSWYWWPRATATTPPPSEATTAPSSPQGPITVDVDSEDDNVSEYACKTGDLGPKMTSIRVQTDSHTEKYKKALKLTSKEITSLNLQPGRNEISYSVTTQYQGTSRCTAYIYLWKWDDKIIVSDIDGTITRSDVLGQILPVIGKDWSQAGIANLYNLINQNGYKFLYLSARAIGQARITRDYLRSVQQGELRLPDGPLLLSPSSLISAFHKEVIERKPEEFKISCLRDVQLLFPQTSNVFVAGYGNKINDVFAYRAVGIPISRIFTVNHRGELKMEFNPKFQTTYNKMSDIADHLFPPLLNRAPGQVEAGNFSSPEEFSTFTYWRDPLPDIDVSVGVVKK